MFYDWLGDLTARIEAQTPTFFVLGRHLLTLFLLFWPAYSAARMQRRFWLIPLALLVINVVLNVGLYLGGSYETLSQFFVPDAPFTPDDLPG